MLTSPPPQGETGEIAISMQGVDKWYGDFHVLKGINLEVKPGEKIVICGPSGSGKSTLIRCINGLEPHEKGRIVVDGTELTRDLRNLQKIRSEAGMVFQSFNLFPHLTVLENLCLAPVWVRRTPEGGSRGAGAQAAWSACASRSRRINFRDSFPAASSSASPSRGRCR